MSDIRIAAFGRPVMRGWIVDGLPCCTYTGWAGTLNGYVRLPMSHPDLLLAQAAEALPPQAFTFEGRPGLSQQRGYDYVDVDVPGGWTYGPDGENWIGFDTCHAWDSWSVEQRRANVADDPVEAAHLEVVLDIEERFGMGRMPRLPRDRVWSVEAVEAEVETAARILAMRARAAIRDIIREMTGER